MTILVDVHTHLDYHVFEKDIDQVIERAKAAGVKRIITNGIDAQTNRKALELASRFDIVEAALGIYPQDALAAEVDEESENPLKVKPFDVDEELEFIKKQKPIALGEVGLEYKYGTDFETQKKVFQKFIELGEKLNVPLLIHSRKAELDVVEMIESSSIKKAVMHCFCGKLKLAKRAYDNGCFFSIPTNVVRNEHFQKIVEIVDIGKIFTETDAPYLSPFPGKRNEPAFITESVNKIAEIKKMTVEETGNNIFKNYLSIF
ncbi:TatD family hydrolase [Candidatus Woesearchaeota archaeon]|jgi:TatD DNase family protein|nr:TatD family hydrolase [Candidatus Woesearchaeota archaeon]MBT6518702.1 TatD family hydrolase [Candidatus Woesearchaeota archaeon]MBT7368376.1 TatD family hydrolase [Candidatus Woesearchaeota archaeon]